MIDCSELGARQISSARKEKSSSSNAADATSATVLFISNDDILRTKTRALLESEGILVFSSVDAQCASEVVFCAHDVNVLILDEESLGLRAMELALELSTTHPRSPVIVLTGVSTPTDIFERIHSLGWRALRQPVPSAILLGVIRQMLAGQMPTGQEKGRRACSARRSRRTAEILVFPPPVPYVRHSSEKRSLRLVPREGES